MSSKLQNCRRICTEHLIFQQHSLLRGIKSESGEITTEDISRYCFEVLLGFSIYVNQSWFRAHTAQSCNLLHQNNHLFQSSAQIATLLGCVGFIIFQLGGEIKNAGFDCFQRCLVLTICCLTFVAIRNLRSAPPKILFVISCILFLACIPVR